MAIETIKTRIKNKVDSIADWSNSSSTLLDGEIAIVRVPTGDTYNNPVTGKDEPVVELLMKVGDGESTFANLPWLSAKASDVYDWAKKGAIEDVPVTILVGTTSASSTLGGWIKSINDKAATNASDISANSLAITKLNGSNTTEGSVAKAIKDAIDNLDVNTTGDGTFVKAVTQTDGKISVTMGKIAESELPDVFASKIKVNNNNTTLTEKLSDMDAAIASKADAHNHDAYVNQNAFSNITIKKSGGGTSDVTVKADTVTDTVEFEGSNITITGTDSTGNPADKITFSVADANATTAGVVKLGATGGAAAYDSIFGSDGNGGINAQVNANKTDIADLRLIVTGGVHFIGTVTAKPTTSSVSVTKDGTTKTVIAAAGDIVVWAAESLEYIYTGSAWEELGDPSGLGAMIDALDYDPKILPSGNPTDHKFVTKVTQIDGLIAATYAQPTSADISHGDDTVATKFEAVDAAIAAKADSGHTHTPYVNQNAFSNIKVGTTTVAADTTTDTVEFVGSNITITPDATNDEITFTVADGSTSAKGIVQLDNTVTSTSTSLAATANAVKTAYDLATEAKAEAAAKAPQEHEHPYLPNTTKYAGSATIGGAANSANKVNKSITVQLNSGSEEGTNKFTFDGSSAKTVNITPGAIGAAASDHGHAAHEARTSAIEGNYIRFNSNDSKLYVGKDGVNEIIFDCGGAE